MQQQYGTPQAEPVQPLSQQDYIAAREAVIVSKTIAEPQEGDTKKDTWPGSSVNVEYEFTFYQGQWVRNMDLPPDHPNCTDLPF